MAPTEEEGPPAGERHVAGTTQIRIQMNTSEALNKAADIVQERGWTQGPMGWDAEGPVCVLGGIYAAVDLRVIHGSYCTWEGCELEPVKAIARHLDVEVGVDGLGIYRWNDALERTAADVIETLRAAAIIAAAQEVDVRVVAPEAELTAVSLADVAGAVTA